jgi:hypothetical protein
MDLTDAAIDFSVRLSLESAVVIHKTVGAGVTITNIAGGLFKVNLVPDDTSVMVFPLGTTAMMCVWDARVTLQDESAFTVAAGALAVVRPVTR